MSTKSKPGDGTHGKGTKGGSGSEGLLSFLTQIWRGLVNYSKS